VHVELFDERYSTAEAQRILAGRRHAREDRDALAAALILQAWLDARREVRS
jgi:RNase H-fold protein (predicted Holliday junction resolvase)